MWGGGNPFGVLAHPQGGVWGRYVNANPSGLLPQKVFLELCPKVLLGLLGPAATVHGL